MSDYSAFIASKQHEGADHGVRPVWLPPFLMDFQGVLAEWSIRKGRPALLSAVAYMLQGAGLTVQQLAEHMGVKLEAAPIALPPKPHDADKLLPRELEVLQRIDTQDGASIPDLMAMFSISIQTASGYVARLERLGRIVRVKAPGVRAPRCFVDPAAAQRWADSHRERADAELARVRQSMEAKHQAERERIAAKQAERERKAAEKEAKAKAKAAAPKPAPKPRPAPTPAQNVTIMAAKSASVRLAGEAVETASTRRTIDSTKRPNSRIEATPALPPDPRWPSFSSTRPGQNPDTGREWVAR